jgi:hypothetical protein
MKYRLINDRAVFNAVGRNVDYLAGLVLFMRDKKHIDCDLLLSREQYRSIKNNAEDASFFALLNVGLFVKD